MSAVLACIDATVQEHLHPSFWPTSWFCCRYRDDIFILAPKRLSQTEILNVHRNLNILYGPDLTVELESVSYTSTHFLEYNLQVTDGQLITSHYNKNSLKEQSKHIIHYPSISSSHTNSQFISTVVGALIRAQKLSNTTSTKMISVLQVLQEFIAKGYKFKYLARAVSYLRFNLGFIQTLRNWLWSRCRLEGCVK
jgi:hypothetical protein